MVYHQYTMASPRYHRLAPERRAHILAVARRHLAQGGTAASYNKIIRDTGISKTTAYLYFDGKDDLVAEVRRDLFARLREVLGESPETRTRDAFWLWLRCASAALMRHLLAHPDDLAVLGCGAQPGEARVFDAWLEEVLGKGKVLGIVRDDVPHSLLFAATAALFRVIDEWALAALARGESVTDDVGLQLLEGLWCKPVGKHAFRKGSTP